MTLFNKLALLQDQIDVPKSQYNKFGNFYYRNVEDIQSAVKPLLVKHGLVLTVQDELVLIGDRYYIKATATISDGEQSLSTTAYARESESKKGMDDSMCTGTSSSYARKYALGGLLVLDDQKDADHADNREQGNKESSPTPPEPEKPWYNDFDKHKSVMEQRIAEGESPEKIIESLAEKFKINKEVRQKITNLSR
jgi:hypothetical protein